MTNENDNTYSRGSVWRKWDLHFHTPSSHDYGNKSISNEEIINELFNNEISVVAITDHHIIDIERITELQKLGHEKGITVLPGIEFLSDARGKDPVHFIAIFNVNCNLQHIWEQIKNKTDIVRIYSENLEVDSVYCDFKDTVKLVKDLGGIITVHAGSKSNSIENITHSLPHTMAQKKEIADIIDIFELGKVEDQSDYKKHVFPAIGRVVPMIICSDNHNVKKYVTKENLWIKADPNFDGLIHALNEPNDNRFFIGKTPDILEKISNNKTKYIKNICIDTIEDLNDNSDIWFKSVNIPLNYELVVIIGNKGNGKSAISDIIGLCTDSENQNNFLFLNDKSFKKNGLANRFNASIEFESGAKTEKRPLNYTIQNYHKQKVRYLPQSYFEKICNEVNEINSFRKEIEKVVFQYIPEEKTLNKKDFNELISYKKEIVDAEINSFILKIKELNEFIIILEDKKNPEYKKSIESKKHIKEEELRVHLENKPTEVENPEIKHDCPDSLVRQNKLQEWQGKYAIVSEHIIDTNTNIVNLSKNIDDLKRIRREIEIKENELKEFILHKKEYALNLGLKISEIVNFNFNFNEIDTIIGEKETAFLNAKKDLLQDDNYKEKEYDNLSLKSKQERCIFEIEKIKNELSSEQIEYQNYISKLLLWNKKRLEIEGDENTQGSLIFLKKEIDFIDNDLGKILNENRDKRLNLSKNIYNKKKEIKNFYDEIKVEIDKKLHDDEIIDFEINSSFYCTNDFVGKFLSYIHQGKSGTFYGKYEGAEKLNSIINSLDWNNDEEISKFLIKMITLLEHDQREDKKNGDIFINELIQNRQEFYLYLYSLEYIDAHYQLQQNGKSIEKLSPGEKGALLLIFYLILDKEDIPLIIDQPEDNLDNHSVATVLVPYIRIAKKRRQIIMVTHNPNLAVVSDAEQVIRVKIDKENGNEFSFISGSIENSIINQAIVDVLEGTMPAFSTRKIKYKVE